MAGKTASQSGRVGTKQKHSLRRDATQTSSLLQRHSVPSLDRDAAARDCFLTSRIFNTPAATLRTRASATAIMATISFDINDALKLYMSDPTTIPTSEADGALFDCENDPEGLTNPVLNPVINPIVDAVADNPDAIMRAANFDSLQFLLKYVSLHACRPVLTLQIHLFPTHTRPQQGL